MKKIIAVLTLILLSGFLGAQNYHYKADFLSTPVSCALSTTLVNGVGFNSVEIRVSGTATPGIGTVTVTFSRAAGSASTVDFEFQVSYDGGTTWTTKPYVTIMPETQYDAVSNVVRYTRPVYLYGTSHWRLYRIVNNDGANNLTLCNASLTY